HGWSGDDSTLAHQAKCLASTLTVLANDSIEFVEIHWLLNVIDGKRKRFRCQSTSLRRCDDDGDFSQLRLMMRRNSLQECRTIDNWHHEIEDDASRPLVFRKIQKKIERDLPIFGSENFVAFEFQRLDELFANVVIIFDDQDFLNRHLRPP